MLIIPAIDIKNGKCVSLKQGNFDSEIVYGDDPVIVAKRWESEGAQLLHIVDLDGAKSGILANLNLVKEIIRNVRIPVQVGGGVRSLDAVEKLIAIGVSKVILGTVALENEDLLKQVLNRYPSQTIVALDSKNGKLVTRGWQEKTNISLIDSVVELKKLGIKKFIYTNVLKDGTLTKPNYDEIGKLMKVIKTPLIISGGISTLIDIQRLKTMGASGVIVGKALYEGKFNLGEAINAS